MYKIMDVPVEIKCKNLHRTTIASKDAVYHHKAGWICDCGNWTSYDKDNHASIRKDARYVYFEEKE